MRFGSEALRPSEITCNVVPCFLYWQYYLPRFQVILVVASPAASRLLWRIAD